MRQRPVTFRLATFSPAAIILAAVGAARAESAPASASAPAASAALIASAPATGSLRIHVTAAQGGTQYRSPGELKWRALMAGADLAEGVELRTGPKGTIQFTVGADQVFRVDRLTVVRVLRAALQPDGTIKTDVGMNYGRVSKDVDTPDRPHEDTIVSPGSTLAVRGTRVSLYDQPPYAPEAVSLTGAAVYRGFHKIPLALGGKGEGTAKVAGDASSAGQYQLQTTQVDPKGPFAGRTQEEVALLTQLGVYGGADLRNLGVFQFLAARGAAAFKTSLIGALPISQQLSFQMIWRGQPFSDVDLTVRSPLGELVADDNRMVPSGGLKNPPDGIANGTGVGTEQINWPKSFPPGSYTFTTSDTTGGNAVAKVIVFQNVNSLHPVLVGVFTDNLNNGNPAGSHTVTVPVPGSVTSGTTGGTGSGAAIAAPRTARSAKAIRVSPSIPAAAFRRRP